jgi:hypothetical protein
LIRRSAIAKVAAVGVLAVLIMAGAVGVYFYTQAPVGFTTTSTSASVSTSEANTNSSGIGPAGGYQSSDGKPQGAWAAYLGYLPAGYSLAPHYPNAPVYPCPPGMNPTQCTQFQASCGNGVCDPNESCATCRIDCGVPGQLTCDPYTGRAGAPVSVCQVGGIA